MADDDGVYGHYIIYVDESGDHGLTSIDPTYPVFVLAFCIFHKDTYSNQITPALQTLKYRYFGHDIVNIHSHDIRKQTGDFRILRNPAVRETFMDDLSKFMNEADFTIIASCIHKERLKNQYKTPVNPYELAMQFCLERLHLHLAELGQNDRATHVVFERRGKREDRDLELEFRRLVGARTSVGALPYFDIIFADKSHNSTGLQIADLVAHPIGRHIVKPDQPNRAYDILEEKFRRSAGGKIAGYGLKNFP